jgi:aromatic-amino-acid transaminase
MTASLLAAVEMAPRDPILGVSEAFNADLNPHKVNLGIGVYCNDDGKVPVLECVKRAEHTLAKVGAPSRCCSAPTMSASAKTAS